MAGWPLVGRSEELDVVVAALRDDSLAGVVLAGRAGVGKTRLAREAADRAAASGARVMWAAGAKALATIPFGAVAHLFGDAAPEAATVDRLGLVRQVARELAGDGGASLLVIDDAHLLDDGTAALVQFVVSARSARVILTIRSGEPIPDGITALWKDGHVARVDVQPLGPLDVEQLLASALGGSIAPQALDRLQTLSAGNALFLRELLASAQLSGALEQRGDEWTWHDRFRPSGRLHELVDERFGRLDDRATDVLEHLAVGEPLPLDVVTELGGADAVARLEQAGLIVIAASTGSARGDAHDAQPVVRFGHPLYQEVLLDRIGVAQRRAIAATLARVSVDRVDSPGARLRVAAWLLEANSDADAAVLTQAARIANALYDPAFAERLALRAIEQGAGSEAALILGGALNRLGRADDGEAVLASCIATTDDEHIELASARYHGLVNRSGFLPEFAAVLSDAELAVSDPDAVAYLRGHRATLLGFAGDFDGAHALAATVREHAQQSPSARGRLALLRSVPGSGVAWILDGRPDRAATLARDSLGWAIESARETPEALFWVISTLITALAVSGRLDEADGTIAQAEAASPVVDRGERIDAFFAFSNGLVEVTRGRARSAQRLLEGDDGIGEIPSVALAGASLVEAYAMTQDGVRAAIAYARAERAVARIGAFEGVLRRAAVWLAVARGQLTRAVDLAADAARWCEANGHHSPELFALHDLVRFGRAPDALERLEVLVPHCESALAPLMLAHARAAVASDGAELERVAGAFESQGVFLRAAEAASAASACEREAGRAARADRLSTRAQTLLARCDGARPATVTTRRELTPLTSREREVALLAASGLSSSAIGERLFIARRTAEGHLQRAYEKLGVNSRADLARHFGTE